MRELTLTRWNDICNHPRGDQGENSNGDPHGQFGGLFVTETKYIELLQNYDCRLKDVYTEQ
jgi:hypothetical protein